MPSLSQIRLKRLRTLSSDSSSRTEILITATASLAFPSPKKRAASGRPNARGIVTPDLRTFNRIPDHALTRLRASLYCEVRSARGGIAMWQGKGLQNPHPRFKSGCRLQSDHPPLTWTLARDGGRLFTGGNGRGGSHASDGILRRARP